MMWSIDEAIAYYLKQMQRQPGYWEDCGTYWAWRGGPNGFCAPPERKKAE